RMGMASLRALAWDGVGQRAHNWRFSSTSLGAVPAGGIHRSKSHASVNTENAASFFIVGTPSNSHDYKDGSGHRWGKRTHKIAGRLSGGGIGKVKPAANHLRSGSMNVAQPETSS